MAKRTYRWLFLTVALGGLAADQVSKYEVFRRLYNDGRGDSVQIFEGKLELLAQFDASRRADCPLTSYSGEVMPRVNRGALFGLGNSHKDRANMIFAGVCVVATLGILIWGLRRPAAEDRWLTLSLGLILSGTVGNFYDRVVFGGVRDFIHFYWFEWPVFNVADCGLVVGAGILLLHAFFTPTEAKPDAAAA